MVYQDLFESRFNELRHDYAEANEGRGYSGPVRTFLRKLTSRP